ncbi:MAG: prolipoprotein diacylglyceryl transferase [Oscillospiraceae bacterium]|nr:prolipoprotein diacylglyceryl transferase [Oscillospiraceae bacterium]
MLSTLISAASAFPEVELTFPNLFGGITLSYYQGFELFGIKIYWYGVLITIGVILAYLYAMHRSKDFGLGKDRMFDVVFVALIGGFLGARIYYCVFQTLDPNSGMSFDFITTFTTIRDGGLAIYGGIIGGFLCGFIACKVRKVNFRAMADLAAMGFLIGQCIGRWGNFINQEAFGAVCSPDWVFGMTSTDIIQKSGFDAGTLVHPCFLYESVWCLVGFIALHFYSKKLRTFDGEIALLYAAWYGLGRAWIEGLRTDSLMIGQFRVSQLVAGASFVVGTALVIVFKILTEKKHIPLYVNTDACRELQEADKAAEEERARKKAEKKAEKTAPSILSEDAENITLDGDDSVKSGETEADSADESANAEEADSTDVAEEVEDKDISAVSESEEAAEETEENKQDESEE